MAQHGAASSAVRYCSSRSPGATSSAPSRMLVTVISISASISGLRPLGNAAGRKLVWRAIASISGVLHALARRTLHERQREVTVGEAGRCGAESGVRQRLCAPELRLTVPPEAGERVMTPEAGSQYFATSCCGCTAGHSHCCPRRTSRQAPPDRSTMSTRCAGDKPAAAPSAAEAAVPAPDFPCLVRTERGAVRFPTRKQNDACRRDTEACQRTSHRSE